MTMGDRPHPTTHTDEYLALILDELIGQREVLVGIRDRLPAPMPPPTGEQEAAGQSAAPVAIREPAPTTEPVPRKAATAKRAPAAPKET